MPQLYPLEKNCQMSVIQVDGSSTIVDNASVAGTAPAER